MTPSKKDLAALIDAYADAKASGNPLLVNMAKAHIEHALDRLYSGKGDEDVQSEQY